MKNWLIKKLGGYTQEQYSDLVELQKKSSRYNIHFPEYKELATGRVHLHECFLGNWKEGKCIEHNIKQK